MTTKLTPEQEAVIVHPTGKHARVLAVAGSGKTTTLGHRVKHLMLDCGVKPTTIRVLMFNRLARQQFVERLTALGLKTELQPEVHTFHSFAYQFIGAMVTKGLLPAKSEFWLDDREELIWITLKRAISNLERNRAIPPNAVEAEDAVEAIGLWKSSLIPPDRAGYRRNPYMPAVYREFEELRWQRNAFTYDDFVPLAVDILESERSVSAEWCERADHVIVDEYQDVNFGQQRLIELLAGKRADVMVVGDDDQTIYEWRGARPHYIIREFRTVFANKPHVDYKLSRSFRFGPVIAQCAANLIAFNTNRVEKRLVAHATAKPARLHVFEELPEQATDANRELTGEVLTLVKQKGVRPASIIVLGRMFAQLTGMQTEFLARRVPFRVVGQAPFLQRRELRTLLAYARLARALNSPVNADAESWVLAVANTPSRKLTREALSQAMQRARTRGLTVRQGMSALVERSDTPFSPAQRERMAELIQFLDRLSERLRKENSLLAGELLRWIVDCLNYKAHYDDFYGPGENSYERKQAVEQFLVYAQASRLKPFDLLTHVDNMDTTRGAPEQDQIVMTTIFRTKGLEYDYVFVPAVEEGYMPCLYATDNCVFDTAGVVMEPQPSEVVENERRLFYVAITRAKEAVYIGTSSPNGKGSRRHSASHLPSRFLDEIQLAPTVSVMTPVQQLAAGDRGARRELMAAVERFGGNRRVMDNLTSSYLRGIGDQGLLGEVARLLGRSPNQPFAYRFAHEPPQVTGGRAPSQSPSLHHSWASVRY